VTPTVLSFRQPFRKEYQSFIARDWPIWPKGHMHGLPRLESSGMTGRTRLCWTMAAFLWSSGCGVLGPNPLPNGVESFDSAAGLQRVAYRPEAQTNTSPCISKGLVIILDGAGGFGYASRIIGGTIAEAKMPLEVRSFSWTHGYCRVFSDQMHAAHTRREGRKLAELILRCKQEASDQPIYLIGHSAGCGVALIGAEQLPPNTLERIVLLAPAVSSKRDLRGALRSSCQGIDAFISSHDWACLGLGTTVMGTTDRCWSTGAAGKNGFQPIVVSPEDEALYAKLRQYPWDSSLMWTGHKGGHYGSYQPGFLRVFVLPLLCR
jgi:pimeloyl-ACP methyl ester carboxylesterase